MEEPGQPQGGRAPDWRPGRSASQAKLDRLILTAGLLFLIDSFLPWYGASGPAAEIRRAFGLSTVVKGWSAGGLAVLAILCAVAAAAFAAINALGADIDLGDVNPGAVYLALGAGAFVFTLLRLLTATSGARYGIFLALILGGVLFWAGLRSYRMSKT